MIVFCEQENVFKLETKRSTYAIKIVREKYPIHLYYGKKTEKIENAYKEYPVDFAPYVASEGPVFSLDTVPTELSFFDSGDTKDVAVKIENANGDETTLFYYRDYRIFKGRANVEGMPCSRGGDETLELIYFDEVSGCELHSFYTVFEDSDTITRYARFDNRSKHSLQIQQATACQLDCKDEKYNLVTLCGWYGKERQLQEAPLQFGVQGIYSKRGHSSHQFNPFMALKKENATENQGEVYGFEFVYSGDFEAQVEKCFDGKIRAMIGLNRNTFSWRLNAGESFYTPETIMTYSDRGMNGLSQNFHDHIRNQILPPKFAFAPRPIVINTWEAMYFNIDENVILRYADKAKELGIDTVVVDDGWFGKRENDSAALGDWFVNREKFKDGLAVFSDKIHEKGLRLGIWIEPEMVNPDSDLYRAHPEWVLQCKDRPCSLGRRQLVLDLTNDDAINFVVERIKETFKGVRLDYIKWDFNRTLSETGSLFLPKERQKEAKHRFVLGSYKMHEKLTKAFPDALFEGCSGGGGRYDAGILYYCPQIWTSDNTDPVCRLSIQQGTETAYPPSVMSCHVSDSLFNDLEKSPDYDFRFNVAQSGVLGYEMNIIRLPVEQEEQIKKQIAQYKRIQHLILQGDFYRLEGLSLGEYGSIYVAKDKSEFLLLYRNLSGSDKKILKIYGLDKNKRYKDDQGGVYCGEKAMKEGIKIHLPSSPYAYISIVGKVEKKDR